TKAAMNANIPAKALINWEAELDNLTKKLRPKVIEKNLGVLKDYIKLCLQNGAKPVGVIFPFAPIIRQNYDEELLTLFRLAIQKLQESYDFTCADLFDLPLGYECFYNTAHLNLRGSAFSSTALSLRLYEKKIVTADNFVDMNYNYFLMLAELLPKEQYNALIDDVFRASAQMIRRKDKIKVGFVSYDASMWCGDELYNFFARDERFEPKIFLCLRADEGDKETVQKDFQNGVAKFKSRGINVVPLFKKDAAVPAQDVLIFLTPYLEVLPNAFQLSILTARTLLAHIPYSFSVSQLYEAFNMPIMFVVWKNFMVSKIALKLLEEKSKLGAPRGLYSGYPKLDPFFEDKSSFLFNWKTARHKSKKIIWAPHWSIDEGVKYSTFQWNYKFMYEFAKAHPEISWVVKPHPNLLFSAVKSGLFPSAGAFEAYLKAWNDLPNAQVCTGAYYQAIFATSDGMILDSGSFIAEYQYVDKPMIFLTRDTQKFNELGEKILAASYCVDGRNLDGIAATMQKVFIEGNDYKAAERKALFDEYLNYPKVNGMLASEFIFKSITDDLKEEH
ncbi:MAG: CDP-glycerol glycerophosphotransferase family protein, partial [Selenomonadaceae bacterium]|nr:CDP-glycerol glycerophosphotransferase family protein [Selenomonadaceae bacterium]